jgi:hypothetical protein
VLFVAQEQPQGDWTYHTPAASYGESVETVRLVAGAGQSAALTWVARDLADQDAVGGFVRASVRTESGGWLAVGTDGEALSFGSTGSDPGLAVGGQGELVLVFSQLAGERHGTALVRQHQAKLHAPESLQDLLSPPILFTNETRVAVNGAGEALVSWYQSVGKSLNVFVSEGSSLEGGFSRPGADEQLSLDQTGPEGLDGIFLDDSRPAVSSQGERAVVWTQPTASGQSGVFLAVRERQAAWHTPASFDDALTGDGIITRCPRIAYSARGDLYLSWLEVAADASRRVQLAHRNREGSWIASGREPFTLSASHGALCPTLATGPDGGVVAAWIESSQDGVDALFVRRSSDAHPQTVEASRWTAATPLTTSQLGSTLGAVSLAVGGASDRVAVAWIHDGALQLATFD